jgi:5-formyltetrahydrofolate cyclo-ligase
MLKEELRLLYLQLRSELSHQAIDNASLSIANQALSLPIWSFNYYHIFLQISRKKEVNTQYLLTVLSGKDKNIVIPKVLKGNNIANYLLTDNSRLIENQWGIPEPVEGVQVDDEKVDVVFLPLLAFDSRGHRVGYGRGFYDAFLSKCRKDVIKVGLSLFDPGPDINDLYAGDIAMDYCITPQKVYAF